MYALTCMVGVQQKMANSCKFKGEVEDAYAYGMVGGMPGRE